MQQDVQFFITPEKAADSNQIKQHLADALCKRKTAITDYQILKRSIDARGHNVRILLTVRAYVGEVRESATPDIIEYKDATHAPRSVVIIGAGPAGLFAALQLLQQGIRPIIIERGKDVRSRRRDLAALNKLGIVDADSNYCFGEGGAGTYSDGKLYTRSNKRGDIQQILQCFVQFGAPENILYDAHPHIGTNKLPQIITAMRHSIEAHGGVFHFQKKITSFKINQGQIDAVITASGEAFSADAYILATGHSARDIFTMLHQQAIAIEAKPFALGVRVEHPQGLIDTIQYGRSSIIQTEDESATYLPPASYALVKQYNGRGVFSFCMCPGGIIAPAATAPGEIVVNGWSPSKRNNPFANSGVVVEVKKEDAFYFLKKQNQNISEADPLLMMHFQMAVEQNAFTAGGGGATAPAQRLADFTKNKLSVDLPKNSYLPGLQTSNVQNILPHFIGEALAYSFTAFGKKLKGYLTNDAIVVATESRTSSPVRIPRNANTLTHPQLSNLYPCGEGAGYAGGIVSAAMDGERIAKQIAITVAQ